MEYSPLYSLCSMRSCSDSLYLCLPHNNSDIHQPIYKRFMQPVFNLYDSDAAETAMLKIASFNIGEFVANAKQIFYGALSAKLAMSSKLDLARLTSSPATMPVWLTDGCHLPVKLAQTLARVLLSSHNLLVETGRWSTPAGRIPRADRKCRLCSLGVEDIQHFLTDCPEFEGPRVDLSDELTWHVSMKNLSLLDSFVFCISTSNIDGCLLFAKFLYRVLSHPVLCKACLAPQRAHVPPSHQVC